MDIGRILDDTPKPSLAAQYAHVQELAARSHNLSGDYWLPVPLTRLQKQLTRQVVALHYSDLLSVFDASDESPANSVKDALDSLQSMLDNASLVASHPFLLVDHFLPANLLVRDTPDRLRRASGKFTVLVQLLDLLVAEGRVKKVAVVAQPGKLFDLLEAVMIGRPFKCVRHAGMPLRGVSKDKEKEKENTPQVQAQVHLVPAVGSCDLSAVVDLDLVISFDHRASESTRLADLRRYGSGAGFVPLVRLIAQNSADHTRAAANLQAAAGAVVVLVDRAGAVPPDFQPLYDQGLGFLQAWSRAPATEPWPLPALPGLKNYSDAEVTESLLSDTVLNSGFSIISDTTGATTNGDGLSAKRPRLDASQPPADYAREEPVDANRLTHTLLRQLEDAQQIVERQQLELESLRQAAEQRQVAYESLYEEMGRHVSRADELEAAVTASQRLADRRQADVQRAQDKQAALLSETEALRVTISQGAPETKTLQELQDRVVTLERDNKGLSDRLEARGTEHDYMRAEYQRASAAAQEAVGRVKMLEQENKGLSDRLAQDLVSARSRSIEAELAAKDAEVAELRQRLELLEEGLRRPQSGEKAGRQSVRSSSRATSVN